MNQEKQREVYEKMLKNGEIESYTYKGGYIFTKDALIDYLVKTANDKGKRYSIRGDKKCQAPFKALGIQLHFLCRIGETYK